MKLISLLGSSIRISYFTDYECRRVWCCFFFFPFFPAFLWGGGRGGIVGSLFLVFFISGNGFNPSPGRIEESRVEE